MLFLIVVLQTVVYAITTLFLRNKIQRLALLLCNIAFFLYSCFGIATYQLEEKYYFSYLACMITFNIVFTVGDKLCVATAKERIIDNVIYGCKSDYTLQSCAQYLKWVTIVYFVARIAWLIYPEFNLKYIFAAPNFIYRNSLEAANLSVSNPLGKIFSTLTTITLPFALIYIRRSENKKHIIWFFIFDTYAQYLMGRASIGRLSIIKNILVVCLVFYITETNRRKKRRNVRLSAVAILLSFMIYLVMENWRNGNSMSFLDAGIGESIKHFVDSELFYPRHYPLADSLHDQGVYPAIIFWAWLFTLPIPKVIFNLPFIDSYASVIYRVFTYYYWGGHWGNESGYAGMLLSVMGDGILVYGVNFAFVLVIPFALFIGLFLRYLLKLKGGEIMYCTTLFYFVVSFRPGVQYALQYVNAFVGMLLIIFAFRLFTKENNYLKR